MTEKLNITLPKEVKLQMKDFARECCNGNMSAMIWRLFRERNKESRLSKDSFSNVVRAVIKEENEEIYNRLEQLRLAVGGAANIGKGCKCGARGCSNDQV